jgi:hypothetical protein
MAPALATGSPDTSRELTPAWQPLKQGASWERWDQAIFPLRDWSRQMTVAGWGLGGVGAAVYSGVAEVSVYVGAQWRGWGRPLARKPHRRIREECSLDF